MQPQVDILGGEFGLGQGRATCNFGSPIGMTALPRIGRVKL
jgi:hypothetical protein